MTVSSLSRPSGSSSSQHSSEGSDAKTAKPSSTPRQRAPISPTVSRLRTLPSGTTRPSTPIPLRPSAPPALRGHTRLPSAPVAPTSVAPLRPLRKTSKGPSPPLAHSNMQSVASKPQPRTAVKADPPPAPSSWNTVKTLGRATMKRSAVGSSTLQRGILSSRNGSVSEGHAKEYSSDTADAASLIIPNLDEYDKENHGLHTTLPPTPNSSVFPPSVSECSSMNSAKSPSAKSVRWAEISVFPEQQGLLNIHGLLKTLIEQSSQEIKDICTLLRDYLPQPGTLSERKYTLRSAQEEELEHALRILDGALYRNLDPAAVEKARKDLERLAPVIRVRKRDQFLEAFQANSFSVALRHPPIPSRGREAQDRASSAEGGACPRSRSTRHSRIGDQVGAAASGS
ncbi:hypothetical protein M408DRAFT_254966 [Serendipita vermifera MAFF 305830]|uniref:Uncharacterized protein n=1 Tax=Serendipita vermifera MAFF 305830 TaxID=933852 RepID=A0A0C2XQE9_SERVB|nr:hypothetical protein M408DRAFT_254966 [Serendipita vermifera MAFF 305830]